MSLGEKVVWSGSEKKAPMGRGSGGCTRSGDGDEDGEEKKAAPTSFNLPQLLSVQLLNRV